jgi:hypothetical protein
VSAVGISVVVSLRLCPGGHSRVTRGAGWEKNQLLLLHHERVKKIIQAGVTDDRCMLDQLYFNIPGKKKHTPGARPEKAQ